MAKDKKSSGPTLREKMLARKKALESKGGIQGFIFCKEGTTRIRIKSPGPDEELGIEVVQFYLGEKIGTVYSPQTFGEPCPIMEKYQELHNSSDPDDKELAKKLIPKRRYLVGGLIYEDDKGKKFAYNGEDKVIVLTRQVYQDVITLFLDEDEAGDMTDPKTGYDIKVMRSGKGQFDTTYSVMACRPTKLDKEHSKDVALEKMVREQIKDYDELEGLLKAYLNESPAEEDDDEDIKPKKKKKADKEDKVLKKKKKKVADI